MLCYGRSKKIVILPCFCHVQKQQNAPGNPISPGPLKRLSEGSLALKFVIEPTMFALFCGIGASHA